MTKISLNTYENIEWFKHECQCFDLTVRSVVSNDETYLLLFLGGITSSSSVQPIVQGLAESPDNLIFLNATVSSASSLEEAYQMMLQGQTVVFKMNSMMCAVVDTRAIPGRTTSEPSVEKSIRGARDGFVETLMINLGLIRKRIKAQDLRIQSFQFGSKTHTDVAVFYIDSLVQRNVLDDLMERMNRVSSDLNLQSERELADALYHQWYNPYPHVRFTERPDLVCIHLLQGQIAVLTDHSPVAMLVPLTLFECTSQIEELTQPPLVSLMLRLLRTLGLLISVFLLPLWICTLEFSSFQQLAFFVFQVMAVDCIIEWVRLSLIHSPSILSSMLSMIAVFLLGETAVKYGAYTQEMLILVAISNVGNFVTSSYELSMANKLTRFFLVLCTLFYQRAGFALGLFICVLILLNTDCGPVSYLYPVLPFDKKEFLRLVSGKKK